jgi:hypothetical protein
VVQEVPLRVKAADATSLLAQVPWNPSDVLAAGRDDHAHPGLPAWLSWDRNRDDAYPEGGS